MNNTVLKNEANLPLPLQMFLVNYRYNPQSSNFNDPIISASSFTRSTRYIICELISRYPDKFPHYDVNIIQDLDLQHKISSTIGSAVHTGIEDSINNYERNLELLGYDKKFIDRVCINPTEPSPDKINIYTEKRVFKQVDNFVVSGQFDCVIDGELHDYKTTSTYVYMSGVNVDKFILQGSIYRWLNQDLITSDYIVIDYIFTDWSSRGKFSNKDYPEYKAMSVKYPLLSIYETEKFIKEKLNKVVRYWNTKIEDIPCCSQELTNNGKSVFKFYKTGFIEGKKSTKNFDSFSEAMLYKQKNGGIGDIIEVKPKIYPCIYCRDDDIPSFEVKPSQLNIEII